MFWEGSLLTAQSISLGTHRSMTQNLIRKLLSLVGKNLPKKLGRALKKKSKCACFPWILGKKNPTSFFFWSLIWGQSGVGVRGGRGWPMMEPKGSGCARVWNLEGFPFHHVVGRLWPALRQSNHQSSGALCWPFSLHAAWSCIQGSPRPADCLGEPDRQMSWSEARPFLFSVESHCSANGQPYSIKKNWVRPGLSSTLLSNLSFWLIKLIL